MYLSMREKSARKETAAVSTFGCSREYINLGFSRKFFNQLLNKPVGEFQTYCFIRALDFPVYNGTHRYTYDVQVYATKTLSQRKTGFRKRFFGWKPINLSHRRN